ncbi:hypothetical protein [Azotobacter armeniacus]
MLAINSTVLEIMQEFVDRRDGRKPDTPLAFLQTKRTPPNSGFVRHL